VPQFERLAFASSLNKLSEPFATDFGWHVLEVTDREMQESARTELKSQARDALRRRKAEERYSEWLTSLRDRSFVELRGFARNFQ